MKVGCLYNDEIITAGIFMNKTVETFYSHTEYEVSMHCLEEMPAYQKIIEEGGDITLRDKELELFVHKLGSYIQNLLASKYDENVSRRYRGYMRILFGKEYYIAVRGFIVDREIDCWYFNYERYLVALENNLSLYFIQKPYYSLNTLTANYAGYVVMLMEDNLNEGHRICIDDLLPKTDWWMMKNNLPLLDRERLEEVLQLLMDFGYVAREGEEVFFTEKGIVAYFRYPPWVTPPPEEPYDPDAFDPEWG